MLHAEPTTVHLAFPDRKQYAIPSYQRNYVWTREGQWEPLWEDLQALTQQVLAHGEAAHPHFLGTLITKQVGGQGFIDRWWVVDGQQRLTTLQVLIAASRSVFQHRDLSQCASILGSRLVNPSEVVQQQPDRFKIQHKSRDYEGFTRIIEAGLEGCSLPEDVSRQLRDCYDYFQATVASWIDGLDLEEREPNATALTKAILDKLHVVDIRLDTPENGHAIFEALNARGEPLTEWEKTKNYLLSIAVSPDDPDGDGTYGTHLARYDDDPYWEQKVRVPRFTGRRMDVLLFFFAQIELPRRRQEASGSASLQSVQRPRLYRDFRYVGEHLYRKSTQELEALLQRLGRYADIYRQIDVRDSDSFSDYARLVMSRREVLNLASLVPVLMVLVDRLGYGEELDGALRVFDSYLMRRLTVKANYSGFDDVAFDFVQALRDAAPGQVHAVLIDQLERATGPSRWPTDDEVFLHLRDANMYQNISGPRIRLLLEGVARRMHQERDVDLAMPFLAKKGLTVEHVAPQDWEQHWKDDLGFGDSLEDELRLDQLVHRIGNLTLVTRALNPKLGNLSWPHKENLLREDNLEMNRRLLEDMKGETWNENEINRRGNIIARYITEIWPHAAMLRKELEIESDGSAAEELVSGLAPSIAQSLVDGVTGTGVEEGWADLEGVNRRWRDDRYGRYVYLGGGDRWRGAWFGVGKREHRLTLDFWEPEDAPACFVEVPGDVGFGEQLESVTRQVREIAETIAVGDEP